MQNSIICHLTLFNFIMTLYPSRRRLFRYLSFTSSCNLCWLSFLMLKGDCPSLPHSVRHWIDAVKHTLGANHFISIEECNVLLTVGVINNIRISGREEKFQSLIKINNVPRHPMSEENAWRSSRAPIIVSYFISPILHVFLNSL